MDITLDEQEVSAVLRYKINAGNFNISRNNCFA